MGHANPTKHPVTGLPPSQPVQRRNHPQLDHAPETWTQ